MSILINICDKVLDERYWTLTSARVHYTGHVYRNSPYESDDNCGTCDGARCDMCRRVVEKAHYDFSIYSDELYNMLLEMGVPEDEAQDISYSDFGPNRKNKYKLIWPAYWMLEESYPEFYSKLLTIDAETLDVLDYYLKRNTYETYGQLRDAIFDHYGLKYDDKYHGHIPNQLELYWTMCRHDHTVALNPESIKFIKQEA